MTISIKNKRANMRLVVPLLAAAFLTACGGSSNNNDTDTENRTFEVTLTNLTANQPISPLAVIAHRTGYHAFNEGVTATSGLEQLAESGDNSALLVEAESAPEFLDSSVPDGPALPGLSTSVTVSVTAGSETYLSLVAMLGNTNDGFTGLNNYDVSELAVEESSSMFLPAWDAGTELNAETAATVPGPAGNGEGYNPERNDIVDFVAIHRGVISNADGLTDSTLDESHRFDNPTARLVIKRID